MAEGVAQVGLAAVRRGARVALAEPRVRLAARVQLAAQRRARPIQVGQAVA